jgi:hypothetical protein
MKKIFILALGISALVACNNAADHSEHRKDGYSEKATTPEDSLFKLVMDGHDVGMGKMNRIRDYQQQSKKALDSLVKLPASSSKDQLTQKYKGIQEELRYAEYSMNTWMEEFNLDSAKENEAARLEYLEKEHEKVEKVTTGILATLQKADSIFKKN